MTVAFFVIAAAVLAFSAYVSGRQQLHMAQLEGYRPRQYWWWMIHSLKHIYFKELMLFLTPLLIYVLSKTKFYNGILAYVLLFVWSAAGVYITYRELKNKRETKKPLVYTHRAIRLFICFFLILTFIIFLSCKYARNPVELIFCLASVRLLLPIIMLLTVSIMYPLEMAYQLRYYRSAQYKIKSMDNLRVIGITGSYGKTSTKYFMKAILSEKYNTLMTPESYNTSMGITRVIREQLSDEHQVFICEMGARNPGDIRTLCRLVSPTIGVLTSIGPQHLETMKTMENVVRTKNELIECLPYYGTAVFNGDNKYCLALARKTGIETYIYGAENKDFDFYITAKDIENSTEGLKFRVVGEEGIDFECRTALLGKHNVSNMLAAISVALKLGLTVDEIQRGISKIEPVPHRLQLLKTNNGVSVIDDAFNSNPEGAKEALETIRSFTGSRVVVTPGMIELGPVQHKENKKLGRIIADCCDYAILIGIKRSKPIIQGLKEKGFPEDRIIVVTSLNEAAKRLGKIVKPGDVVLFENDLPDNYTEL